MGTGGYACVLGGDDGRAQFLGTAPGFAEHERRDTREAALLPVRVDVPRPEPAVPVLDAAQRRRRLASAPVARLATLRRDGTPRLVPITFALVGDVLCSAVDDVKPKRSTRLARLDDVRRDPRVAVVADHYDVDWSALWWVRVDGTAAVHESGPVRSAALAALVEKYPQYAAARPDGAVLVITPRRWTGWSAT